MNNNPGAFFKILPDLLRIVQDLSLDELIAVAQGIDAPLTSDSTEDGQSITKMVLMLIAAEQDPIRILGMQDFMAHREMKMGVLGSLARQDPEAAQRWLKSADIPSSQKSQFQAILLAQTMRQDVNAGLKLFMEMPIDERSNSGPFGTIPVTKEQIPELIEAIEKPEFAEIKGQIAGIILTSTLMEAGVTAVRKQTETLDLAPDELKDYITKMTWQTMQSEPNETLEWINDALSEDQQLEAVPNAINTWAQQDYNAAGEYLGQLPPSPVRDRSILLFSQMVFHLDPESAAIWTLEIEDPGTRKLAIQQTIGTWNLKDKPAADKWLQDNSIDLAAIEALPDSKPIRLQVPN
jgi:hypothetical protein